MNKVKMLALLVCVAASDVSLARPEISANVSIGSDYIYRGISQTGQNPSIQGGFDLAAESGLYAGVWASNVAFDGSLEVDLYAGYGASFSEEISYDLGVLRYEYPDDAQGGAPESSFNELYASLAFKGLTLGLAYTADFFAESAQAVYFYTNYDLALANDFSLNFHYGNQAIEGNDAFGAPDYSDYSLGLSKSLSGLDLSLTAYGTDLSDAECFGGSEDCQSNIVFALGKSL